VRRSAASITPKVVISNNVCPQLPVLPKTFSYLPELRWFGNNTIAIAEIPGLSSVLWQLCHSTAEAVVATKGDGPALLLGDAPAHFQ
jgi:hypothetical protein